jgi:hypothetical protein
LAAAGIVARRHDAGDDPQKIMLGASSTIFIGFSDA